MTTALTRRGLALTAMIFAVAMTFIDQTIVSVAAPSIQSELGLSGTGLQWGVNSYLLAMAALFVLGGRLADTVGRRTMVTIGIVVFAAASGLCGLTPAGGLAEAWLVTCRALQGAGGALMYPAALAIVVDAYEVKQRGKALALFFGIAGGLTAVGPAVGGYLSAWTWRSIFWINIPVALIALVLVASSKPSNDRRRAALDLPGIALITSGVALTVVGLQQSAQWGWTDTRTLGALAIGLALLIAFVGVELRVAHPLMNVSIFRDRSFRVDNLVLFLATVVFVPVFFFASEYGQVALGQSASTASLMLLYFFAGFVVAAQVGGRMLDRVGARRPVFVGAVLAAVGLRLWAEHATMLSVGHQVGYIVLAGAGMGLLLGQANTDALNHAPSTAYGQATGITQTVRNFGASLGLAVLGTVFVTALRADHVGGGRPVPGAIPHAVQLDVAHATSSVLTVMSWVMVAAAVVAFAGLPRHARRTATRRQQIRIACDG